MLDSKFKNFRLISSTLLAILLLCPAAAPAVDDAPTAPTDPVFIVITTDGPPLEGRIRQLGPDNRLVLDLDQSSSANLATSTPAPRSLDLNRVVSLTRRGADPAPSPPLGSLVLFPEGDRLRAIIGPLQENALTLIPPAFGDVATPLPLDRLQGVIFAPPSASEQVEALIRQIRAEPKNAEVLWLANGDRINGSLLDLGSSVVKFESDTGPVSVPRSTVVALGFDPALVNYPRPEGLYLELTFMDGSRLGVGNPRVEKGRLIASTRFGSEINIAISSLSRVHFRSPLIAYLSERDAAASEFVGYLSTHPGTYGRDLTWNGHGLRMAGQPYDRGLGMLPRCLLAYRIEPADSRFQALVGLDDRAGPRSSVVFRVLVDGKERFASPALTPRQAPVPVDIDLAGGRLLILVVEFGDAGDVQDNAVWAEARIIKSSN